MFIELTDRDSGHRVLVNMARVAGMIASVSEKGGTFVNYDGDYAETVSETLDEIAEKVQALGGRVLLKGDAT
jgi:hypothetical protein